MESIFHEKQEGALCAQHCLNSLLQGPYFNAVDLATIAKNLDDAERQRMAEGSVNSMEYYNFMQQPSSNMDDSGYFSIQVICKALEVWNLEMIQYNSPAAEQTRQNPVAETAYICNQQNHWLTIRKLGQQWFNLNSIKSNPELISDTYLSLLLAQLQAEGYSIYVIVGTFPECEAEQLLRLCPVSTEDYKQFANSQRLKNSVKKENPEQTDKTIVIDSEPAIPVDAAAVRDKRLNFFEKLAEKKSEPSNEPMNNVNDMSEEEMLKVAMEMSLEPME